MHLDPIPPPRIVLCRLFNSRRPPRRGGGGLCVDFSVAHCGARRTALPLAEYATELKNTTELKYATKLKKFARVSRAGPAPTWAVLAARLYLWRNTQQSNKNSPGDQKFGSSLFKGSQGSKGRRPWSPSAEGETPCIRRRSKRVNSKTVRWTVFEEEKPCKRGFPFEKHGRSFPQAACGLTAGAVLAGSCVHLHPIPPPA